MSDYIKREDAIEAIDDIKDIHEDSWLGARYALKHNIPSADAVEVVRCKDCKHYAGEGMYCACDIIVHYDHFYCYYGERADT